MKNENQLATKVQNTDCYETGRIGNRGKEDLIGASLSYRNRVTPVDASIAYDLNKIKSQFQNNDSTLK